jgi:hypothetical protein
MDKQIELTRRGLMSAGAGGLALSLSSAVTAQRAVQPAGMAVLDPIRTELVMNLVVTCSSPEPVAPNGASKGSKDGVRGEIWPIIGGKFEGPSIRGIVVPGGGDFPVTRPDGVEVIDALYRLRTDDGVTILIHNKGLMYREMVGKWPKFRLVPEFTAPVGKYDWLNRSIFLSTLLEVPPAMAVATGPDQNDRLIQVHRVL